MSVALRAGATRILHDIVVVELSPARSRELRNSLARAAVLVDPDAGDEQVRIPALGNGETSLERVLDVLRRDARQHGDASISFSYGAGSYQLSPIPPRSRRRTRS